MTNKELLLSPNGRIKRMNYWLVSVPIGVITFLAPAMDQKATGSPMGPFYFATVLVTLWPLLMVGIKRAHDRNKPGWFLLLYAVPFVNIWVAVELLFLKGTSGKNKYGNVPIDL